MNSLSKTDGVRKPNLGSTAYSRKNLESSLKAIDWRVGKGESRRGYRHGFSRAAGGTVSSTPERDSVSRILESIQREPSGSYEQKTGKRGRREQSSPRVWRSDPAGPRMGIEAEEEQLYSDVSM